MVSNRAKHQTQLNKQSSNIALKIVLKRHLESSNKKNTRDYSKRKCNKAKTELSSEFLYRKQLTGFMFL